MEMKKTFFLIISVLLMSLFNYSCIKEANFEGLERIYNDTPKTPKCRTCGTDGVPGSVRSS